MAHESFYQIIAYHRIISEWREFNMKTIYIRRLGWIEGLLIRTKFNSILNEKSFPLHIPFFHDRPDPPTPFIALQSFSYSAVVASWEKLCKSKNWHAISVNEINQIWRVMCARYNLFFYGTNVSKNAFFKTVKNSMNREVNEVRFRIKVYEIFRVNSIDVLLIAWKKC